jgi:GNAT superfamily N-acetyltransferase
MPVHEAFYEGDTLRVTRHYAAFDLEQPVGCATCMFNDWEGEPAWQLRGMGTRADLRGRGVGAALLGFVEAELRETAPRVDGLQTDGARGAPLRVRWLWCNARVAAVPFYEGRGWRVVSEVFDVPTVGPHHRMLRRLD